MKIPFDELLEEKERRRIAPDWESSTIAEKFEAFNYFCETYWTIKHPTGGRIPFILSEAQKETTIAWLTHDRSIILKARQLGFSTLAGAFCVWATYFYSDRHVVMLSKTEREAVKLLNKAKYGFEYLPKWMLYSGPVYDSNNTKLAFSNYSLIESLPSGGEPARGETLWLVVIDEWAFLPNPDQAWASIEGSVDLGGRVIGLSTANGEGNIFFRFWSRSKNYGDGSSRWYGIFHPWWADGLASRDQDWYDLQKNELPDWQLAQEYPADPEEAFVRSGRPVFDVTKLKADSAVPAQMHGTLVEGKDGIFLDTSERPELAVWEEPQQGKVYVIGADVAEGLEHGDFSAAYVIEARNQKVVAAWHGKVDPDLFGSEVLYNLGKWYGYCLLGVESNNHGISTLKALQNKKYPRLYQERQWNKTDNKQTRKLGFRTTQTSKPAIINELGRMIRQETLWIPDERTLHELRTFVREGDRKMHGSPYDDRTMALAITAWMLQFVWLAEYEPDERYEPGMAGWWEELLYKTEKEKTFVIGAHATMK